MNTFFTVKTEVTETAELWAIPRDQDDIDFDRNELDDDDPDLFTYQIRAHAWAPYNEGAVKVAEVRVTAQIPEGINLVEKAIETLEVAIGDEQEKLEKRIEELRVENAKKKHRLEDQIKNLQRLTYTSETPEL